MELVEEEKGWRVNWVTQVHVEKQPLNGSISNGMHIV